MKKKLAIAVLVVGLGFIGLNQASAGWGARGGCPNFQGPAYSQLDPATQEKLQTFYSETQDARRAMVTKQAEYRALMRGENPDPAVTSKVAGELFDLRAAMRQKAEEAGVSSFIGPCGGAGFGPESCRPGMRGHGKGGRAMGGPGF